MAQLINLEWFSLTFRIKSELLAWRWKLCLGPPLISLASFPPLSLVGWTSGTMSSFFVKLCTLVPCTQAALWLQSSHRPSLSCHPQLRASQSPFLEQDQPSFTLCTVQLYHLLAHKWTWHHFLESSSTSHPFVRQISVQCTALSPGVDIYWA